METTKQTPVQPLNKSAEVIHISILRAAREQRRQAAEASATSVENRNLSAAWSR